MTSQRKPSSSRPPWKALVVVAAVLVGVSVASYRSGDQASGRRDSGSGGQSQSPTKSLPPYYSDLRGVILPKTMPPGRFREGKSRSAYGVAAKIPEILAQLPCYCPCDRKVGHKSLLDCYTDEHAAYCDICQDSALLAEKRVKENAGVATIRQEIVDRYSETH